jgi:DNA-binding MarR family transcriptional regulator
MAPTPHECAAEILDTIPVTLWALRAHMRTHRTPESLSMPQFGAMLYLRRHDGASLSEAAEYLELALPSASKLINGLVERGVVSRQAHPADRRRVSLGLTPAGRRLLEAVHEANVTFLAQLLAGLSPSERATVADAMRALRAAVRPQRPAEVGVRR